MSEQIPFNEEPKQFKGAFRVTRTVMFLAVVTIFIGTTALLLLAVAEMLGAVWHTLTHFSESSPDQLRLEMIEAVDIVLVCTVLYIIAIGLYELFVDARIRPHLPRWLQTYDIRELEARLAGMVITVLAVIFLTRVLDWNGEDEILGLGVAVGIVIAAISFFLLVDSRNEIIIEQEVEEKAAEQAEQAKETGAL